MRTLLTTAAATLVITVTGASMLSAQNQIRLMPPAPAWESAEEMHDNYVRRFESLPGFGLSRMWQPPMQDLSGQLDLGRAHYTIASLELVGLLKRDPPVVYVTSAHPDLVKPVTVANRELTTFEKAAVDALRKGQDIATSGGDGSETMAVVGALRAKVSCQRCHSTAKLGDLLGAFSYTLRRGGL